MLFIGSKKFVHEIIHPHNETNVSFTLTSSFAWQLLITTCFLHFFMLGISQIYTPEMPVWMQTSYFHYLLDGIAMLKYLPCC